MARAARLTVPGLAHVVQWRALAGLQLWDAADDRRDFERLLTDICLTERMPVHAYALRTDGVLLLLRPAHEAHLSRVLQALGRRFGALFNRRHGRVGPLWCGRFLSCALEPGAPTLDALVWCEGGDAGMQRAGDAGNAGEASPGMELGHDRSSLKQRLNPTPRSVVADCPEWWGLGNTPFERERHYVQRLEQGVSKQALVDFQRALLGGWPVGSARFCAELASQLGRTTRPAARGRPSKRAVSG